VVPLSSRPPWSIIHGMSREDPQFKLRMPSQLRAQAEQSAKAAGRSLNAELVARLEASFLTEEPERLLPAKRAKELALMARAGLPEEIRRRSIKSIARAISLGHNETFVSLDDLNLDIGIPDDELEKLIHGIIFELKNAGYDAGCDDISALWIKF